MVGGGLADKRRGSLPGGRARVFWAGPLCGIRAETVVCCAGMAHVDALHGSGDVDERERVGRRREKSTIKEAATLPRELQSTERSRMRTPERPIGGRTTVNVRR